MNKRENTKKIKRKLTLIYMIIAHFNGEIKIIKADDYPTEKQYYSAIWRSKYGMVIPKQDMTKYIVEHAKGKKIS